MDLRNTKVMVSSREESKQVQTRLFELGFKWITDSTTPFYYGECCLFIDEGMLTQSDIMDYSTKHSNKEVTVADIMSTFPEEYVVKVESKGQGNEVIGLAYDEDTDENTYFIEPSRTILINNKVKGESSGQKGHAGCGLKYAKNKDCPVYQYEDWIKWFRKEESTDDNIIGYKLKSDCEQYLPAIKAILGEPYVWSDIGLHTDIKHKLESANVLDLWFEPQYKPKYELPLINGHQGKDRDNKIHFGCQSFSYETILEMHKTFHKMNLTSVTLKVENTVVDFDDLKAIIDYIRNK